MKRILLLVAMILGVCGTAHGQGWRYDGIAFGRGGYPAGGVTVAICTQPAVTTTMPCSTLATLYTDATLGTPCTGTLLGPGVPGSPCSNPMLADSLGNYHFYATTSVYTIQFYGGGITPFFLPDQNVGVASILSSNNTWTGTNTFNAAVNLNSGGQFAGTFIGTPTFSGALNFSGTPSFSHATGVSPFTVSSTTLVSNLNAQTWNGVTPSNNPAGSGQVCLTSSTTVCAWTNNTIAGYKLETVNITPATVANTVTPTNLQTFTIAANEIGAAQSIFISASGIYNYTAAGPTLTLDVRLDGVTVSTVVVTLTGAGAERWTFTGGFTGVTTGVGGTVVPHTSTFTVNNIANAVTPSGSAPTVVVDTTISHTLTIRATWSVNDPMNTVTSNAMTIYRIG